MFQEEPQEKPQEEPQEPGQTIGLRTMGRAAVDPDTIARVQERVIAEAERPSDTAPQTPTKELLLRQMAAVTKERGPSALQSIGPQDEDTSILGVLKEDVRSVMEVGRQIFLGAQATAQSFISDPLGTTKAVGQIALGGNVNPPLMLEGVMGLTEIAADVNALPEITETDELRFQRGIALTAATLASGGVAGVMRTAGSMVTKGLLPTFGGAAARMGGNATFLAGDGLTFASVFGSIRPLGESERTRIDALTHDMMMFPLFGFGLGVVGSGTKTIAKALPGFIRPPAEATIEETIHSLGRELVKREPSSIVPGEALTWDEVLVQWGAGATKDGVTKTGFEGHVARLSADFFDFLFTRFPEVRRINPELHTRLLQYADARTAGTIFGLRAGDYVTRGLSRKEASVFTRGLMAARGRQIKNDLERAAQIAEIEGRDHIIGSRRYTPTELRELADAVSIDRVLTEAEKVIFDSSPAIRRAVDKHREVILPYLTQMRTRNGLHSLVTPDEPFLPLIGASEDDVARGFEVYFTKGVGEASLAERAAPLGTRTTPGARPALGQSDAYLADYTELMTTVFRKEFAVDRKNDLIAALLMDDTVTPVAAKGFGLRGEPLFESVPAKQLVTLKGVKKQPQAESDYVVEKFFGNPMLLARRQGVHMAVDPTSREMMVQALQARGLHGAELERAIAFLEAQRMLPPPTTSVVPRTGEAVVARRDVIGPRRPGAGPSGQQQLPPGEARDLILYEGEGIGYEAFGEAAGFGAVEPELGRFAVPKVISDALRELENPRANFLEFDRLGPPMVEAYKRTMDMATAWLLASPVEVVAHSNRILSMLSTVPGVGAELFGGAGQLINAIPYFGPRINSLLEIARVGSKEYLEAEARLLRVPGAIPNRAFASEFSNLKRPGLVDAAVKRIDKDGTSTVLQNVLRVHHKGHEALEWRELGRDFLFGLPGRPGAKGKTNFGLDMRARVVATAALDRTLLKHLGRKATDTELMQFLMSFGAYSEAVQSQAAVWLRRSRFNPFAAGQQGFVKNEFLRAFGGLSLPRATKEALADAAVVKLQAETLYRGTMGTVLALALLNYGASGKWPWENDPGFLFDINTGQKDPKTGGDIYVPFTLYQPVISRAIRNSGVRSLAEGLATIGSLDSDGVLQKTVTELRSDIGNLALTYGVGGPGPQALTKGVLGAAPFLYQSSTGETEMMDVVLPQPTASAMAKETGFAMLSQANPTLETLMGQGKLKGNADILQVAAGLGFKLKVGPAPSLRTELGVVESERRFRDLEDALSRNVVKIYTTHPLDPAKRMEEYQKLAEKFDDPLALPSMIRFDQALQQQRSIGGSLRRKVAGSAFVP